MTGVIKRLTDRGFGFVTLDGSKKDLFFHANDVENTDFNTLTEGQRLSFDVVEHLGRERARGVRLIP